MPTVVPSPDPVGLPAPAWLLQVLLVFTFVLHLLAMNFLVGGVVFMGLAYRRGRTSAYFEKLGDRLSKALPPCMAMTITLGVAPLLFLQVLYGQAFYTTSALMAWPWFAIVPLVLIAYYGLYIVQFKPEWLGRHRVTISWISALFILFVGLMFTSNSVLMLEPSKWSGMYASSASGLHLELGDDGIWARYVHYIVSALAVAGLGLGLLAKLYAKQDPDWYSETAAYGAKWFTWGTFVSALMGMWFLFSIPKEQRLAFMGGSSVDTGVLWAGVLLAFAAVHFASKRSTWPAVLLVTGSISLMAVARYRLRQMYLDPVIDPSVERVVPQWDVFVVFVVLLFAGLGLAAWMVLKLGKASSASNEDLTIPPDLRVPARKEV